MHGRFGLNHYSKMGCDFGLGLVSGLESGFGGRVRIIRFIQVKSGSHCIGHAAVSSSHPYFGIVV